MKKLSSLSGISEPGGVTEVALDSWQRTLDINLTGTFNGCRAAIPAMVSSGEPCAIVNIGSMLALRPGGMFAAYCASKAAVTALTRTIALDCAKKGWNRGELVGRDGLEPSTKRLKVSCSTN